MAVRPSEELIVDRSANDVQLNNAKGNYNVSDFARIKEWQIYINEYLNENGYYVEPLIIHEDWDKTSLPRFSDIKDIKDNLQKLKDAFYVYQTTPAVPSTSKDNVTYNDANDIEKIMLDLEKLINNMVAQFIWCGTIYCGE